MNPATVSDEQLWRLASEGDRQAFAKIVEKYQTLVCSLAYSMCGTLGSSEDMAQETFITAWHRLKDLREPTKLRQWLCGIVRNIAANALRRELRRGGPPESLDAAATESSLDDDPGAQLITREEESLLWRSLAELPESYREPLILFYREEKSVAEVALKLDLTEDTVRQRLSRGRAMLRDEMTALVESTLTRTRPGTAFTIGVLVALPLVSASSASAALAVRAAASGGASTAGKAIIAKLGLGALVGPVIGLICAYAGTAAAASTARSKAERQCILRYTRRRIIPFCFIMSIGLAAVLSQAGKLYPVSAAGVVVGVTAWTAALVGGILFWSYQMERETKRIRVETHTTDDVLAAEGKSVRLPKYFESRTRFFGLPLFAIVWTGSTADRNPSRPVLAWVAIGDVAISPFIAAGGIAVGSIAIGGITVGVFSVSVFWGVAIGVLAIGSLAFGWWALGCAAVAVKCAVGFAAVAHDYAVGFATSAAEAGTTVAKEWVKTRWFSDCTHLMLHHAHWWLVLCAAVALALRLSRNRQPRRV